MQESRDLAVKLPEFDIVAVKHADANALGAVNADRERLSIMASLRNRLVGWHLGDHVFDSVVACEFARQRLERAQRRR